MMQILKKTCFGFGSYFPVKSITELGLVAVRYFSEVRAGQFADQLVISMGVFDRPYLKEIFEIVRADTDSGCLGDRCRIEAKSGLFRRLQ